MATASSSKPKHARSHKKSSSLHSSRSSVNLHKTEITINIYDLLPPSRLSNILWSLGGGLLHSGVVIHDREYAYGAHNRRGLTGVYYTKPGHEPPGGRFRTAVLQGFSMLPPAEIEAVVRRVSDDFQGPAYNLLTRNCNHFTSALCEALTRRPAPAWLNRAASIGLALPCVVPKEWISVPDADAQDGEMLEGVEGGGEDGAERDNENEDGDDEHDDDDAGESTAMLKSDRKRQRWWEHVKEEEEERKRREGEEEGTSLAGGSRIRSSTGTPPPRLVSLKDTSGRELPVAERAPMPSARRS